MRALILLILLGLIACSKSGSNVDPGNQTPYSFSINLILGSVSHDSVLQGARFSLESSGNISGKVNHYDPAILKDSVYFKIVGNSAFQFRTALDASGNFSFVDTALLGKMFGTIGFKLYLKAKDSKFKPSPDTLRFSINRRLPYPWSLNLTMPGGKTFQNLTQDTSLTDTATGFIRGQVNQFNNMALIDTIYFKNLHYIDLISQAPLDDSGRFQIEMYDWVGLVDGSHVIVVKLQPASSEFRPLPDSIRINLTR